ncbi:NYN domain-containing protein [uncultured Halomonas sp.]|uniref:NYN domain-containing protein n=1 Tax=uncultured Halomonas sp. TaxID=173971 RepID=UPI00261FA52A|nr:NYN domain-containing protein [uncultured Halomonas sp.]
MPTAILVDGAYFIKRFRRIEPENAYDAKRAADCLHRWAVSHLHDGNGGKGKQPRRDLYRIFFYDCPPLTKKMHNPITKMAIDFSKTNEAIFRSELHAELLGKRKLAVRLGHLSDDAQWTIKPQVIRELLKGKIKFDDIGENDVQIDIRQKGVDMRIGVDVTSLTLKKQVDQIVLIAGDADFVPAAKIARREGIDFVLDPMWQTIPSGLHEHIDGLQSRCPKPKKLAVKN